MIYNAKEEKLYINGVKMDYITFGKGTKPLVMIQGLNTNGVKGAAVSLAYMYRVFAKDFKVYLFDRRENIKEDVTIKDLTEDTALAMDTLGIKDACILGVSQGGMIAQYLAADYPEKVNKLVLTVTCARPNCVLKESVGEWISYAKQGDHAAFMDSNLRRIYSEKYYRSNRWMIPIVGKLTKPETYERFFVQADACLTHDAYDCLQKLRLPTLVIGGEKDQALGGDASREIASQIPDAELKMYAQWGHGLYEEAKDFNQTVLRFLMREMKDDH